jgi:hypothetical protein
MRIVDEVDSERQRLAGNADYHLPDSVLYKLLWEDEWISRKGQTPFTKDQYNAYMGRDKTQKIFPSLLYTPNDWLRNNIALVREMRREFQTQLDEGQTGYDELYLNIFLRYIYEKKIMTSPS